jgi:hypothetical protein
MTSPAAPRDQLASSGSVHPRRYRFFGCRGRPDVMRSRINPRRRHVVSGPFVLEHDGGPPLNEVSGWPRLRRRIGPPRTHPAHRRNKHHGDQAADLRPFNPQADSLLQVLVARVGHPSAFVPHIALRVRPSRGGPLLLSSNDPGHLARRGQCVPLLSRTPPVPDCDPPRRSSPRTLPYKSSLSPICLLGHPRASRCGGLIR